ncbi:hypothetical protein TNCT_137501 [Trichonephila clavata]|uniref:Protein kinase domain-containing protein n=1 Tax=Trichonephila clavata TaxID=2740835 RepID=A0A8X6KRI2_TRICU|nr:hypothetical protein TNCT_137501 [Trichonephila clavata]
MGEIPGLAQNLFEDKDIDSDGIALELMPYNLEPYNVPESHAYGKCRLVTDFEKISYIGEGAYGSVFKCKDKKYDLIVALKKLRIRHEDRPLPRNFMREITIMKELQHDNVATLIGIAVGRNFASTYLILEYYPYDLSKIIDDAVAKPFILHPEIKCIIIQLLYGLDYIHHHNVLHRDLAVSNILFSDIGVLKISDFGCSRFLGSENEEMTPNKVSRWYRAPELLFGDTKYTSAIDIWSAGCIFAELLLKEPLFKANSDNNLLSMFIETLGTPTEETWPGFKELPLLKDHELCEQRYNKLPLKFTDQPTSCIALLHKIFVYNPEKRFSAEKCLSHPYFTEEPTACNLETLLVLLKKSEEI